MKSRELPNYEIPSFDSIGANEYIVDVTHPDAVDFISTMDTPYPWELNIWYHTLNVGFRTRISGETDFPCITDARVGQGRVYAKVDGPLSYGGWVEALRAGRSYVSDGRSHLMDFSVNDIEVGTNASEVRLIGRGTVHARVKVSAYLSPVASGSDSIPSDRGNYFWRAALNNRNSSADNIHDRPIDQTPYWHLERARIGSTREVPVELVVNGKPLARKNIVADGSVRDIAFDLKFPRQNSPTPKQLTTTRARFIPNSSRNAHNKWKWCGPFYYGAPTNRSAAPGLVINSQPTVTSMLCSDHGQL